jgi:O-antigen ligase
VFVAAMWVMVPGLVGTIRHLFSAIGSDSSTLSRTNASSTAVDLFLHSPVFGRGAGTFLPQNYVILDDQWLLSLVETGAVGISVTLALFVSGFLAARRARQASNDPRARELGLSLSAGVAAAVVAFGTFDAFSFPMCSGTAFLLVGLCGALYRSQRGLPPDAEHGNSENNADSNTDSNADSNIGSSVGSNISSNIDDNGDGDVPLSPAGALPCR